MQVWSSIGARAPHGLIGVALALLLGGCSSTAFPGLASIKPRPAQPSVVTASLDMAPASGRHDMNGLVSKYAQLYDVPESLVHRVIQRESSYNPKARNGPYYGLMQISYPTAQSMGYRGPAEGLLDADTNLRYAVKYLSGAYLVGGNNQDQAVRNYASGYYYDAKRQGLLEEVGLR